MRAARLHGPRDLRIEDVPVPEPGPGEVLIEVERVGLCGSDAEEYRSPAIARSLPITMGHEVVGTVAGGPLPPGTRVVPDVVVGCGRCGFCARHQEGLCPDLRVRGQHQDGGLARWMLASAATCVPVPAHVSVEAAAFAEPLSVAVRALRKAGDLTGASVVVYGAGTVGQLVVQLLTRGPAAQVVAVDPVPSRRALAESVGALAVSPEEAGALVVPPGRAGADVVLECAGVPDAPREAVRLSRPGGTVVLVGFRSGDLSVPWLDVVLGERRLLGSAAHLWDEDVAAAVALLARGVVDPLPLLSATLPLDRVAEALERPGSKVLIDPSGGTDA